jgi:hypothetical protein
MMFFLGFNGIGCVPVTHPKWVGFKPSKVKIHDKLGLPHFILEPSYSDRIWLGKTFFFAREFGAYFHTKSLCSDLKQCHHQN